MVIESDEFVQVVDPSFTTPPMIPPDSSAFGHKNVRGMEEALMSASSMAYTRLRSAVEHAVLSGSTEVDVVQPEFYYAGRFKFHWSVFIHGLKRNSQRDRTPWTRRKLLVPFEQLRRDLAKNGYYLVLRYEDSGARACVFTKDQIELNDEFSLDFKHDVISLGRHVWLYERDGGELKCPYQMVPF